MQKSSQSVTIHPLHIFVAFMLGVLSTTLIIRYQSLLSIYPGYNLKDAFSKRTATPSSLSIGDPALDDPSIEIPSRFWTCNHNPDDKEQKKRKVFFVHVYKTAGTTFRQFFRNYAHVCNRRSVTMRCTTLKHQSLANQTSIWSLKSSKVSHNLGYDGGPCIPLDFVDGESNVSERKNITDPVEIEAYNKELNTRLFEQVTYGKLRSNDVDMVLGHTPIGLHSNWLVNDGEENSSKEVTPLYITFFRDPVAKFVSGRLEYNRQLNEKKKNYWTFEEAVENIKALILDGNTWNGLNGYFLTPAQKEMNLNKTMTIKSNLVELPVLVGIIERMEDSLSLIRYVMNSDGNPVVDQMLDSLDSTQKSTEDTKLRRRLFEKNVSPLSTSALVREIQKDSEVFAKLKEGLRDEVEVYDYAVELHKKQVQRLSRITN